MRAGVNGVDVVGEAEGSFRVSVVVLQRNLHVDAVALGIHVDGLIVQDRLAAVQMLDELGNAAVVLKFGPLGFPVLAAACPPSGRVFSQPFLLNPTPPRRSPSLSYVATLA